VSCFTRSDTTLCFADWNQTDGLFAQLTTGIRLLISTLRFNLEVGMFSPKTCMIYKVVVGNKLILIAGENLRIAYIQLSNSNLR